MFFSSLSNFSYADIRVEKGKELVVKITEDEIKVSSGDYAISSARVLKNGSWGFASSNNPEVSLDALLKEAEKLALLEKANVRVASLKKEKFRSAKKFSIREDEDLVRELKRAAKEIQGRYIKNKSIAYHDWIVEKEFYNSEGSEIFQSYNRAYLSCIAVAKYDSIIQRGHETAASIAGFKDINAIETARTAKEKAEKYLFAKPAPKGRFVAILDPEMTGVFCHEALGHACEADSIIDRESILRGKLGKRIGSELVTIVDDPTAKEFGYYLYDDEGVKSRKVHLVKNGILLNYMNSRETSKKLGAKPNGHARAEGADHVPIVRMSNTFMLPGKSKLDEIFDIKSGIYLKGMAGGSVDIFSGSFMFKAEEAYFVKNGEKRELLRDVALSGNILETLKLVESVGRDFGTSPGICGKFGQSVPVSDGGPHIRISNIKVG